MDTSHVNLTKDNNNSNQNNITENQDNQQMGGGVYGNISYQQYQPVNNQNVHAPNYMLWLILGIIQILNMCCCNPFTAVCGIITMVLAIKADKEFLKGNFYEYQTNMEVAKILNIIGWCLVPVAFILWLIELAELGKAV